MLRMLTTTYYLSYRHILSLHYLSKTVTWDVKDKAVAASHRLSRLESVRDGFESGQPNARQLHLFKV